jgi:hypothetical protein
MGPKKLTRRTLIILIAFAVLLIGVVPGYFFYSHYEKTQKQLENPTDAAKEEVAKTVEAVGKLILLPSDEEPTLATVSDKTKVQDQALIQANVRNGDKILIYSQAKKAYLYRPSLNKLVAIAPVNIGEQAPTLAPVNIAPTGKTTPTPSTKPTGKLTPTSKITPTPTSAFKAVNIALYNGTRTAGLAARTQTALKTTAPFATVVATGNAANTYTDTLVIDFTGKYSKEAAELVKQVGGATGVLPKGEIKPTADILIILGPQ